MPRKTLIRLSLSFSPYILDIACVLSGAEKKVTTLQEEEEGHRDISEPKGESCVCQLYQREII